VKTPISCLINSVRKYAMAATVRRTKGACIGVDARQKKGRTREGAAFALRC
jgi:hypothetical protein